MGTGAKSSHRRVIDLPGYAERPQGEVREEVEAADEWPGESRAELERLGAYVRSGRVDARGLQLSLGGVRAELLRLGSGRRDAAVRLEDHLQDARERAQRLEALWVRCQAGLTALAEGGADAPRRRRRRAAAASGRATKP